VEFASGVQNATPYAGFTSVVSCASVGNCVVTGSFKNLAGDSEAFTMTAVNNAPAPTTTVAPTTTLAPSTTVAPPTEAVVIALPVSNSPLVADDSLSAGTELTITAGGFTPGEFVQLIVASTPQVIGSGYADAQGFVTLTGTIPADLASGSHTIAVFAPGRGVGFKQAITVSGLSLPATGNDQGGILVVALLMITVGAIVVVRRRGLVA
jgi:LPXTG-motif cell wall-anchored protein